ncbi:hypothetical protein THAOC_07867, partial [Thalassiosira oceanica]
MPRWLSPVCAVVLPWSTVTTLLDCPALHAYAPPRGIGPEPLTGLKTERGSEAGAGRRSPWRGNGGSVKGMMREHPVPPDAMAYGTLLRILSARGQPERVIDVLEEVTASLVLPTHAETGRDERRRRRGGVVDDDGEDGPSEADDAHVYVGAERREEPRAGADHVAPRATREAGHHNGREVARDDGFVASLMRCAAAAGDASMVREIYLASRVRRMDHLRTSGVGTTSSVCRDSSEKDRALALGDGAPPLTAPPTFRGVRPGGSGQPRGVREQGVRGRHPSPLDFTAGARQGHGGGGTGEHVGREDQPGIPRVPTRYGYIESFVRPQYENLAIPGLHSVKADEETARARRLLSDGGGEEE